MRSRENHSGPAPQIVAENHAPTPSGIRTFRDLADAVAAQCDLVAVAVGLLASDSESVRLRAFELVTLWKLGDPAKRQSADSAADPVRLVWNMPAPYEKQ
jgi:hypothetical protein